jgi:hypothetical protein
MYKLLLFLKKTDDKQVFAHFEEFTLKHLSNLAGEEIIAGKVESSLLLETKYSHFCEFEVAKKEDMDKLLNSKHGKELNKDLMNYHEYVDLIFVDYVQINK